MTAHVVTTYLPDEEKKEIITSGLADAARVSFAPQKAGPRRTDLLASADVAIGLSFSATEISAQEASAMGNVRLIQLVFAGVDKVPFDHLSPQTAVAGNAGAYAEPIAEHVLALTLSLAKSLVPRQRELATGRFDRTGFNKVLKGGICAIIGLGGNGAAVARLMQAVGMRVWGINRRGQSDAGIDFIGTLSDLKKVLQRADVVVVTAPLTKQTRGLIGARQLAWMKPDALLINVGRGEIIAEKALYEHLCAHPEFGAGIDTWWSEPQSGTAFTPAYPFLALPNLVGSPHNADVVPGIVAEATRLAVANVRKFLKGQPIRGVIDPRDYTGA